MHTRRTVMGTLFLCALAALSAQTINDDFGSMRGWYPGPGDWVVRGGRLVQQDGQEMLARIDRLVGQRETYEIEFAVRYVDGGYATREQLSKGTFHAGFGVQIGAEDPAIGKTSWGVGESYLLWLNLDTREQTRLERPEHYGFRGQVYDSESNIGMELMYSSQIADDPVLSRYTPDGYLSLDIPAALSDMGITLGMDELHRFLGQEVIFNVTVDTKTGRIGVKDPTAPVRFYFDVDPALLQGDYVSLRTNSLAISFDYFTLE